MENMSYKATKCCRGCLGEVDPADAHSFSWPEIRGLFHDCTSLPIPADEGHDLPQQICSECYNNCEKWFAFRTMCHEIDKQLRSVLAMERSYTEIKIEPLEQEEEVYEISNEEQYEELEDGEVEYEEKEFEEMEDEEEEFEEMDDEDDADYEEEEEDDEEEEEYDEPAYQKLDYPKISTPNTQQDEESDCPVCYCQLPETVNLRDHFKEHFSHKNPQCPVCAKQFNRSSKVYPHFLEMHAKKEPQDENANDDLFTRKVQKTDKGKDSNTLHTCPICALKVSSLTMHLAEMHIPPGTRACPLCSKEFDYRVSFLNHLLVHTRERRYPCPIGCYKKFFTFSDLSTHMKNFHSETYHKIKLANPKATTCQLCGWQFLEQTELKEHRRQHNLNMEKHPGKPYKCFYCAKSFISIAVLSKHLIRVHKVGDLKYECPECGEKFVRKKHLRRHRLKSSCVVKKL